jgi:hypothetical protein
MIKRFDFLLSNSSSTMMNKLSLRFSVGKVSFTGRYFSSTEWKPKGSWTVTQHFGTEISALEKNGFSPSILTVCYKLSVWLYLFSSHMPCATQLLEAF